MKNMIFILLFFINSLKAETIHIVKPTLEVLWGIKRIAIAQLSSDTNSGDFVTSLLVSQLRQTKFFDILQVSEIEDKLQQLKLTKADFNNISKSKEICSALKIDGIIVGEISIYKVEPDEYRMEKVQKQIWTGKYERDQNGKIIEENINGQLTKKKLFEDKIVEQQYAIRRGTVNITFNLIDGKYGKLALSSTITKNYNSGKIPDEEIKTLPSSEQILHNLSGEVVSEFVISISPRLVSVKKEIENGEGFIDEGKVYATNGLWKEAIETWLKAERVFPNNSAVYYNLGLAYEAQGEVDKAEIYYKKAALLQDKKLYKKALENLREGWQRKEKKLRQGIK